MKSKFYKDTKTGIVKTDPSDLGEAVPVKWNSCGHFSEGQTALDERFYMNPNTGSVDTHDGWWYELIEIEDGVEISYGEVNAVDREEVIEVKWDEDEQDWVAAG